MKSSTSLRATGNHRKWPGEQTLSAVRTDLRRPLAQRSGFVLVLVLVMILLVGLSVAGFARKSLELAQTVADAQEGLQRRWGSRSCERIILANAARLLDQSTGSSLGSSSAWPLPSGLILEVPLGGFRIQCHVADEEAKINLNALIQRDTSDQSAISNLVPLVSSESGLIARIRLPTSTTPNRVALQTWEQIFDLQAAKNSGDLPQRLRTATGSLTCWGSGKLNLRRASDDTVRILCDGQVSERTIANILARRRAGNFRDLNSLVHLLDLKTKEEAAVKRLFEIESRCYSVWLTVQGPRRSWTKFTVDRSGQGNPVSFEAFSW